METCARERPHARKQKDETIVLLDIKPTNVLLDMAGQSERYPVYPRPRLSDFGSAHITYKDDPENMYNRLEMTVTPGFQAPELNRPPISTVVEEISDEDEDDEGELSDDEDRGDSDSDQQEEEEGLPAPHNLGNLGAYKVTKASDEEGATDHHDLDDSKSAEEEGGLPAPHNLGNLGAYTITKASDGDGDEQDGDEEDGDEEDGDEEDGDEEDGDEEDGDEEDGDEEDGDEGSIHHQDLYESSFDEDENMHVEIPDMEPYDEMDVWEESVEHWESYVGAGNEEAGKEDSEDKEFGDEEARNEEDKDGEDESEQEEDEEDGEEEFTPWYSWTNVWQLGRTIEVMMRTEEVDDCDWDDPDSDKESKIQTDPPYHPKDPDFLYSENLVDLVWQCQQFDPESRPTPTELLDMIKSISPVHNERMDAWGTEDWVQEQYDYMGPLTEDHKKFMKASIQRRAAAGRLWFLDDFEDRNLATRYRELDLDIPEECELIWQPKKFRHRVGQMFGAEESESESESESTERSKNNKRPRTNEAITMTPPKKKQKI